LSVAFGEHAARRVGVRKLVDECHRRMPRLQRCDVEFLALDATCFDHATRKDLEITNHRLGVGAMVRFNEGADDVDAGCLQLLRAVEHRIRLAAPGACSEINRQLAESDA